MKPDFIQRWQLEFGNFLRFNKACLFVASYYIEKSEKLRKHRSQKDIAQSLKRLIKAARVCPSPNQLRKLESNILGRMKELDVSGLDWDWCFPSTRNREIQKGIILKRPVSEHEKGVLFIAFENQWLKLFRYANIDRLAADYDLVLAPTWSPPHDFPFLIAAKMWPGTLYHILSNFDDIPAFQRLADNIITIRLQSSNWVNPDLFDIDNPVHKDFDIVMLANFAFYKRHFLLFKALKKMPPSTKVLLLGRSMDGRTEETIKHEAKIYGVEDRITLRAGLPDKEMIRALRSAKISLIFSGNEGSCVSIVESMFADVPAGVFADANIGSKFYINEKTGKLLHHKNIAVELSDFINTYDQYSPREWVLSNNISCFGSTAVLNSALRENALKSGKIWTEDIVPHFWRPEPVYIDERHSLSFGGVYAEFEKTYGVPIIKE